MIRMGLGMIAVLVLGLRGLYSINVRYIGLSDFLNVVLASFVVMLAMGFMRPLVLLAPAALQSLVGPLFFWGMTCAFLSSVRILRRLWSWRSVPRSDDENAVALIVARQIPPVGESDLPGELELDEGNQRHAV